MPEGEFLEVDMQAKALCCSTAGIAHSLHLQGGSLNDAPVVKALVYLLAHHIMEGQYLGRKDKDDIALWKSVLGAAVKAEVCNA